PVALLISALLTAGYLMPISIKGSLASNINEDAIKKYNEPSLMMLIPIAILAVITLILGMYPMPIINLISDISASLM
ncbi:MAG: proton-conducting membrane transporter, partial [Lachnospiraceae bacterium]|nr:proton-conducting membrane transporter [Lachnospiraceae bacterium]